MISYCGLVSTGIGMYLLKKKVKNLYGCHKNVNEIPFIERNFSSTRH